MEIQNFLGQMDFKNLYLKPSIEHWKIKESLFVMHTVNLS